MASRERGNPEVKRTFERLGGIAEKKTDLYHALRALSRVRGEADDTQHAAGGHPDYTVLLPPFGFYVEAKAGHNNRFDFNQIAEKQRNYLDLYTPISFLWLWMGEGRPNGDDNPHTAWLIPWQDWLAVECHLRAYGRVSIAYDDRAKLGATNLLELYRLIWAGKGCWDILPQHPLWANLTKQAKAFIQRCEQWSTGCGKVDDGQTSLLG